MRRGLETAGNWWLQSARPWPGHGPTNESTRGHRHERRLRCSRGTPVRSSSKPWVTCAPAWISPFRHSNESRSLWGGRGGRGGPLRPFTAANGPVLHHVGAMMKVTVRVDVERHVRDEAARGAGAEPDYRGGDRGGAGGRGRRARQPGEAVAELNRVDCRPGRQGSRGVWSVRRVAQFRRDFRRVKRGAHGRGSDARELVRIGSHAQLGP